MNSVEKWTRHYCKWENWNPAAGRGNAIRDPICCNYPTPTVFAWSKKILHTINKRKAYEKCLLISYLGKQYLSWGYMNKVEGSWPVKDVNTLYNAHPTDLRTPYIDKQFLKKDLQKPLSSKLILSTIEYVHCNRKTSFFSELLPLSNGKKQRIVTPSNRINLTFCKWEQKNLCYFIQKNVKIVFKEPITLNIGGALEPLWLEVRGPFQ